MTIRDNWERSFPITQMGTAELNFFVVDMGVDIETGATLSDSLYSRAIRGLQARTELYLIGQPNGNYFTFAARQNSIPDANPGAITGQCASLEYAIAEASGDDTVLSISINNGGTNNDVGDEFEFAGASSIDPIRVRVTGANAGVATQVQLLDGGVWTDKANLPSNTIGMTRTQTAAGQDYNGTNLQVNLTSWGLMDVRVYYASLDGGSLVWND